MLCCTPRGGQDWVLLLSRDVVIHLRLRLLRRAPRIGSILLGTLQLGDPHGVAGFIDRERNLGINGHWLQLRLMVGAATQQSRGHRRGHALQDHSLTRLCDREVGLSRDDQREVRRLRGSHHLGLIAVQLKFP